MEDARWIMEDGRWKMDNMRDGICIMEDGRLKMEDGRWKMAKENRLYIEWNLLEKSVKRPFCCNVSILQVYFTYLCCITF